MAASSFKVSFKERRQREATRKEQKRAERIGVTTAATGEGLVATLNKGRQINATDLSRIEQVVGFFQDGGNERDLIIENLRLHHKALYRIVEDELKGDWMGAFRQLVAGIPADRRFRPFTITWPEWLQIGMEAGMNEEEVVHALKVLLVFRDR